ncbi:glucosaminidase domain-containing protein [Aquimarina sp. 2201CG1-2-11]|uniref:glucosaminidase domain-containing protein n=1 Tax=Aquimarina discodermiae TaxID=3231043 RepID=UPI003461B716
MRKIILLLSVTAFMISCGSSKKGISTTTTRRPAPKRTTAKTTKKVEKETKVIIGETKTTTEEKKPVPVLPYKDRVRRYIHEFSGIAKKEMKTYGIPASITLAQGILESGAGHGELTQKAKNHFGIKCHDWKGDRVYHDDDRSQECFRKYNRASESFRDHSLFLKNRKRYSKLFTYKQKDYKSWARGLKAAGYATDKKYPQKLISIIERYRLYEFDNDVLGIKNSKIDTRQDHTAPVRTNVVVADGNHIVEKGDTLYSIARRYKISVPALKSINKLGDNTIKIGQVLKVALSKVVEEEEDFN